MKQNIKRILILSVILIISITFLRCQKDDDLANPEIANVASAKKWFNEYESGGDNYGLFQNLDYDWANAEAKKNQDGTELIIVPINEIRKDEREIWEQRLYIYKLGEKNYKALLYERYPDAGNSLIDDFSFNQRVLNDYDKILKNGVVEILSKNKFITRNATAKYRRNLISMVIHLKQLAEYH